ncbi:hypothetical protein BDZ94DRAFT_1294517 [Collybia nuda]|uniref:TPR-like protein n=1 Tax=Collybia nuda TaxID=64659 RepID=A0A9P5YG60_9AGAR|nr:hypothetical protein BDZ94DRAFT_1294517 [Collybia nuda]
MSDDSPEQLTATAKKLATAKQTKDVADQAFKQGNTAAALLNYHQSLMYLLGLDKNALQSIGIASTPVPGSSKDGKDAKEKTEVDDLVEKIYANMSACHMKKENWKRAVETADKALAKNENNYKALFRKGKALGEQGFYEKAVKILEDVKAKNPSDAGIVDAELSRLRIIDNQREKANKQKLKGFLNKAEKKAAAAETPVAGPSSDPA